MFQSFKICLHTPNRPWTHYDVHTKQILIEEWALVSRCFLGSGARFSKGPVLFGPEGKFWYQNLLGSIYVSGQPSPVSTGYLSYPQNLLSNEPVNQSKNPYPVYRPRPKSYRDFRETGPWSEFLRARAHFANSGFWSSLKALKKVIRAKQWHTVILILILILISVKHCEGSDWV